jgi:putative transposase
MSALGLDPNEAAVISLGELDRLIHEAIIAYQNEYHSGIDAVPAHLWDEKIKRHGRRFIPDIRQLNAMLGRVDTGVLSRRGIKFKNMVFHDEGATTTLLNEMTSQTMRRSQSGEPLSSAKVKVKFKYNPADASCIHVWNVASKEYVKLDNVSKRFTRHLSFWQVESIRQFAAEKRMKFGTEEQKWTAREALRQTYDRLAGKKMRDTRDARRSAAQTMGTYDDGREEEEAKTTSMLHRDVLEITGSPSIASELPAMERSESTDPPIGFKPSKAAMKEAEKKREAKKAEAGSEERAENKALKRRAAQQPIKPAAASSTSDVYKARLKNLGWGKKKKD